MSGYVQLATNAEDEDVRRKASDRILDTFLPTQNKIQQASGTTIQIVNALPVPEVRAIGGKESPTVEIAATSYALVSPKKRLIEPESSDEQKRRSQFLGPNKMTGDKLAATESPRPIELPTPLKKL